MRSGTSNHSDGLRSITNAPCDAKNVANCSCAASEIARTVALRTGRLRREQVRIRRDPGIESGREIVAVEHRPISEISFSDQRAHTRIDRLLIPLGELVQDRLGKTSSQRLRAQVLRPRHSADARFGRHLGPLQRLLDVGRARDRVDHDRLIAERLVLIEVRRRNRNAVDRREPVSIDERRDASVERQRRSSAGEPAAIVRARGLPRGPTRMLPPTRPGRAPRSSRPSSSPPMRPGSK